MVDASAKQRAIDIIARLPADATMADISSALRFCQDVDEGLRQLDAGEGIEHDAAKRQLARWLT
jgi:hypothetical protein